jgi:hypothetical protein
MSFRNCQTACLDTQKKQASYKERLQELKKELASLPDIGGTQYQDIAAYYQLASQYLDIRSVLTPHHSTILLT